MHKFSKCPWVYYFSKFHKSPVKRGAQRGAMVFMNTLKWLLIITEILTTTYDIAKINSVCAYIHKIYNFIFLLFSFSKKTTEDRIMCSQNPEDNNAYQAPSRSYRLELFTSFSHLTPKKWWKISGHWKDSLFQKAILMLHHCLEEASLLTMCRDASRRQGVWVSCLTQDFLLDSFSILLDNSCWNPRFIK